MVPKPPQSDPPISRWSLLFKPGFGLKRWLAVFLGGVVLFGLALALVLHEILSHASVAPIVNVLTLQMLPVWQRVLLLGTGGLLLAIRRLEPLLPHHHDTRVA